MESIDDLVQRLTMQKAALESVNRQLSALLTGLVIKYQQKGTVRIEKGILNKVEQYEVDLEQLKSGVVKMKLRARAAPQNGGNED